MGAGAADRGYAACAAALPADNASTAHTQPPPFRSCLSASSGIAFPDRPELSNYPAMGAPRGPGPGYRSKRPPSCSSSLHLPVQAPSPPQPGRWLQRADPAAKPSPSPSLPPEIGNPERQPSQEGRRSRNAVDVRPQAHRQPPPIVGRDRALFRPNGHVDFSLHNSVWGGGRNSYGIFWGGGKFMKAQIEMR